MIAIPDFAAGAMENWGIVTYRETRLLIDSHLSSFTQKCATARTVCHELAHQWFGNLVTMEWWTSLWLNEGFARFMEFEAVHCIFPEWRVWENFVQDITMSTAMVKDSMTTSHPIEVVVNHPDEVDQIFDVISYAKGASIIRMLTEFLGRDVFYRGIHEYLVKFSYRNAQTEDLWDALEQTSGQKITNMANTWTSQTGYPIVTFFENDTKSSFEISQERFFAVQTMKSSLENSLWDIPLTYVSSEYPNSVQQVGIWQASTNFVGNRKSYTTPIRADESITTRCPCPTNGWIKFNPNQAGFYLVNYSSNGWRNLQQPVRDLQLNTVDRMSLLNSIFACARAGIVPVSQALDFSSAYINEPEHLCWTEISSNLRFYLSLFKEELFGPLFQKYVRSLFAGIMKKLTWNPKEGESSTDGQFRRDVISMLGRAGDEEIIEEAKRRFNEYFHHPQSCNLSADLRGVVFSIRARSGDETHATQLRELYERSDFIEEKLDCLSTMGMFSSHEIKLEVLEWSLENVRSQDIQYVFGSVASGVGGAEFCWNFVKDHWVDLNKRFAPYIIGRVVVSVISPFHTEEKAAEVEEYMRTRNHDSYIRVLDAAIEKIRIKSSCYMRDRDSLEKWLMTASF
jgi:puromycin-sensitive aminopeptidase